MAMVRHRAGTELTPERLAEIEVELEEAAKRPYTYDPDCPLISLEPRKLSDYSPEKIERLKAAQKRHAAFDPGCEKLTLEEFINWHPVGGISLEERARRMKAAGITDPDKPVTVPETQET